MSTRVENKANFVDRRNAEVLLEKWDAVLDYSSNKVKAIEDDHVRLTTAMVLESQERYLIENAYSGGSGSAFGAAAVGNQGGNVGNQDFYATGDSRLPKVLIPMIRRTFPELITHEIVGVQAMSGPVGLAFALRYRYDGQSLDYQDPARNTYDATNPTKFRGAPQQQSNGIEAGYNYIDSRYTGSSGTGALSGLGVVGQAGSGTDFDFMPSDMGVAEWLANYEMTGAMPQMTIQFEKTAVEAGTRRLATKWSIELEQDLKNMNGIDIDNELTNTMAYEIQAEIDREMIMRMIQVSLNAGAGYGYSVWVAASADARWLGERNRDLYQKILIEANRIAVRNRRGAANFLIATPTVCAVLENLNEFKFMPVNSTVSTQQTGIAKTGVLAGRFTCYRDTRTEAQQPWVNSNYPSPRRAARLEYVLLGYKGTEYYDTGIVYCPYIPLMVQRTIGPNDFTPRVGLITRYGVVDHLFGADLYYHTIIVKGLGEGFNPSGTHQYL